ncbi:MAG: hypothetical protein K2K16_11770, partial [Ruminococcus sp.]|nr:hypothetical protein [Ruminococcus sp.]
MKAELEFILTRADSKLENVSGIIETTDYTASVSLNNQVSNLISVSGKADALLNTLTGYGAVKEVHGWKPEEEAVVYDISDYIYYDSEKKSYYIKNQKKLRNLLNNENLSDKDKKIIYKILTLMVDDNGNINTKMLEQFLNISYEKEILNESLPSYHTTNVPVSNEYFTYYKTEVVYSQIKYAKYSKSKNIKKICDNLG